MNDNTWLGCSFSGASDAPVQENIILLDGMYKAVISDLSFGKTKKEIISTFPKKTKTTQRYF